MRPNHRNASLVIVLAAACLALGGCYTVKNPDGSTSNVLGFATNEDQVAAQNTVNAAASFLPFPFNYVVGGLGTLGVTLIGAYAARKKGEDIGWDAAHAESKALGGTPAKPPATT